jgi:hypothetical protein
VITAAAHGLSNADTIDITGIKVVDVTENQGWALSTEIDGIGYTVSNKTTNTFELQLNGADVDGEAFATYHSGGEVREAVTSVGGLWHLEGESVVGLANGYVTGALTVANGAVTIPNAASRVAIGLGYTMTVKTLKLDGANVLDSIQGRVKKLSRLTLKLENTLGGWVGPDLEHMKEMRYGLPAQFGQELSMVTEDKHISLSPSWNKNGQIIIQQRDPLPMTILGIVPEVTLGGN